MPQNEIANNLSKLIATFNDKRGFRYKGHPDEKNPKWKGDSVGYSALHAWISRKLGRASFCMFDDTHINRKYEWANMSKKYSRDFTDWKSLCKSCHVRYDFTEETRKKMSLNRIGVPGYWKDKNIPAEARVRMSLAKIGKSAGMLGKKHSEETKRKISETKLANKLAKRELVYA